MLDVRRIIDPPREGFVQVDDPDIGHPILIEDCVYSAFQYRGGVKIDFWI